MQYGFWFKGGVRKPTSQSNEKFLLFFLINGKEVPLYQLIKDGLVNRTQDHPDYFVCWHETAKLFVAEQGFGIAKRFYSFYITLQEPPAPDVRIVPFTPGSSFYFMAKCRFLSREDALNALDPEAESRVFLERQEMLSVATLHQMVTVDKSELKKGVRHLDLKEDPFSK